MIKVGIMVQQDTQGHIAQTTTVPTAPQVWQLGTCFCWA